MTTAPTARGTTRIIGLDGPRGMTAICVIVVHTFGLTAPTQTGRIHAYLALQAVVFFFVLSGFLIFLPFCRAVIDGRPLPRLGRYASARLRRVFPAYLVAFVLANFVFAAVYVANAYEAGVPRSDAGTGRITDPLLVLSQLTLVQNLIPGQLQTGINPSWSLTTELGFYLLLPGLALLLATLVRRHGWRLRVVLVPALLMAAVGLATKTLLEVGQRATGLSYGEAHFGASWHAVITRSVLGQADTFAPGMAVVVLFVTMERGGLQAWTGRRLRTWCTGVLVLGLAGTAACVALQLRFDGTSFAIASGAFMLMVVEPTARGRDPVLGRFADTQPLRFYGDVSLSAYLWHYPVLLLVTRAGLIGSDTPLGVAWSCALVLGVTTLLAWASRKVVEEPAMTLGRRPRRHRYAG